MNDDMKDSLKLVRKKEIGNNKKRKMDASIGSTGADNAAVPDLARKGGGKAPALCSRENAEREIAKVEKFDAKYLLFGQGLYPRLLAELEDAPPLLIVKGNLSLLDRMAVAIVGARNASAAA